MSRSNYCYLGEQNIGIDGPSNLLARIGRNFEESPKEKGEVVGRVIIEEGNFVRFHRDRSKQYLSIGKNKTKDYPGIDLFRYGVLVRTVWKKDPLTFEVINHLPYDESDALSCFKKIYYATSSSRDKTLIHGSLVNLNGKGILITGGCWSGKTSLTLGLIEKLNAVFVSEGNTLVSHSGTSLKGFYLPRPVFVRFYALSSSSRLKAILSNIQSAEAIQPFDEEAIIEIIRDKRYEIDGGLNISRKRFSELIGAKTIPSSRIDRIIYPSFSESGGPEVKILDRLEAFGRLLEREFPKDTSIGDKKHQREITKPQMSQLKQDLLEGVETLSVTFDARKNLSLSLLEDLI